MHALVVLVPLAHLIQARFSSVEERTRNFGGPALMMMINLNPRALAVVAWTFA